MPYLGGEAFSTCKNKEVLGGEAFSRLQKTAGAGCFILKGGGFSRLRAWIGRAVPYLCFIWEERPFFRLRAWISVASEILCSK